MKPCFKLPLTSFSEPQLLIHSSRIALDVKQKLLNPFKTFVLFRIHCIMPFNIAARNFIHTSLFPHDILLHKKSQMKQGA
ncbi:MAG: hypothetical protein A2X49_14325 [Lentisphaerae bacterium GWF2_52_8]|nr:MAG: hypothetical protein A2X49_14325 [Lentisphaerae bacterium GWF2_52_8]